MKSMQFVQWFVRFLTEVKIELSKIEWPRFDDFIGATIVVVVLVAVFSIFFGAVDKAISLLTKYIFTYGLQVEFMKRWYVVQIYAGYEEKIKADIAKRIHEKGLEDLFGQILIPSAKMKQFFDVTNTIQDQQLFPGYMLIEMQATPESIRLVASTPRVLRFLGGNSPIPLSQKEIDRVLGQIKGEVAVTLEKHEFDVGKEVEIIEGAFAGFVGIIDAIDTENEKLTVMVSIFGRMTPVELHFNQVKQQN